jgi:hypothetical protein
VSTSFTLDPAEVTRVAMLSARKLGSVWIWYLVMMMIVAWNTVPIVYAQWRRGGLAAINIPLVLLGLAPLVIIIVGPPLAARWAANRQLRTGPSARGVQQIGVAEWGLEVTGSMHTGVLPWSSVMKAVETPEFFLFFLSKIHPVFIPKRLLTDTEAAQVRQLTRSALGARAQLLES